MKKQVNLIVRVQNEQKVKHHDMHKQNKFLSEHTIMQKQVLRVPG